MAFNGSGSFARLYNWVTDRNNGIKIRADRMDAELDGIATGLSNCITKDGQTTVSGNIPFNDKKITGLGDATADTDALNRRTADARYLELDGTGTMTGVVQAANGTVSAPSYTFGSDTNSGFYRIGADNIGAAVNGTKILDIDTAGLDVTGAMAATGAVSGTTGTFTGAITMQSRAVDAFPTGTLMLFQQTSAPTGWTKQTTHNDKALRVVSGTASSGGTTAFSGVFAARTITTSNLPSHTHTFSATTSSNGNHQHYIAHDSVNNNAARDLSSTNYMHQQARYASGVDDAYSLDGQSTEANIGLTSVNGGHTHTVDGTTGAAGSGSAMDFDVQYVDVVICIKD